MPDIIDPDTGAFLCEGGAAFPLLLTDGGVIFQNYSSLQFHADGRVLKLTPDVNGSYINGTWSEIARIPYVPIFAAQAVLADGRVIIEGGEDNGVNPRFLLTNQGAIYNPVINSWTSVAPPPFFVDLYPPRAVFAPNPRARVAFDWRADLKPFQEMLATLVAEDFRLAAEQDDPDLALCERTPAAAARSLKNYPPEGAVQNSVYFSHEYYEGMVARVQGDEAKAKAAFAVARSEVEKTVEKQPDFAAALSFLGIIDAGLGRKEEAIREGRRACELMPILKDAITGPFLAANLAQIYIWTGEKDLAIAQIEAVERVPNQLSYGFLKLHPIFDPLRGDPRFKKLLASLAPK